MKLVHDTVYAGCVDGGTKVDTEGIDTIVPLENVKRSGEEELNRPHYPINE